MVVGILYGAMEAVAVATMMAGAAAAGAAVVAATRNVRVLKTRAPRWERC